MNDATRNLTIFIGCWTIGAFIVAAIAGAVLGRYDRDHEETTR